MKKYRNKKNNSIIAELANNGWYSVEYNNIPTQYHPLDIELSDNWEWMQPIKNWRIESIKKDGITYTYSPERQLFVDDDYNRNHISYIENAEILSFKVLSTNEVFKVGSYFIEPHEIICKIVKITDTKINYWDIKKDEIVACFINSFALDSIALYVMPNLTTEDGVEIQSPEQIVYIVWDSDFEVHTILAFDVCSVHNNNYKVFTTEKAATEYAKRNKKIYSIADLENMGEDFREYLFGNKYII